MQVVTTLISRDHARFASEYMVSEEGDEIISCILLGYALRIWSSIGYLTMTCRLTAVCFFASASSRVASTTTF